VSEHPEDNLLSGFECSYFENKVCELICHVSLP